MVKKCGSSEPFVRWTLYNVNDICSVLDSM